MGVNPDTYVRHLIKKTRVSWRILCFLGKLRVSGGGGLTVRAARAVSQREGTPPPLQKKGPPRNPENVTIH